MSNSEKAQQLGIVNPALDFSKARMYDTGSPPTIRPVQKPWACSCGAVKQRGSFCMECGTAKADGAVTSRCGQCGWEPIPPIPLSGFCPECGYPLGDTKPGSPELDANKYWRRDNEHF